MLLPLALLAHRRYWQLGLLYGAWLLALVGGTLGLRHVIFHRNLLALFSLAVVLAPLTVGAWLSRWRPWAGLAGTLVVLGGVGLGFVRHNPVREPLALYYYDLPAGFEAAQQRLARLPGGAASVAFSEESFYPYFLYRRAGQLAPHPARRPAPAASYFLRAPNDALPPALAGRYQPVDTVGTYRLWRR